MPKILTGELSELEWIIDSFNHFPIIVKKMFGARGVYLNGKMILLLSEGNNDLVWDGAHFPIEREHHEVVLKRYPYLVQHSILKKWLYLPLQTENFDDLVSPILREIRSQKYEWGIIPKPKKKPVKKKQTLKLKAKTKKKKSK